MENHILILTKRSVKKCLQDQIDAIKAEKRQIILDAGLKIISQ